MLDNVTITGITPLDYYSKCSIDNSKQNVKSVNISIPSQKPDMESVNDVKVSLQLKDFKLINTILGPKVLVNIVSKIKVIYTAKNLEQSLHSAHWDISFCDFILLNNHCYDTCDIHESNLFLGLEDIYILSADERNMELCLLYIIYTNYDSRKCTCNTVKDSNCDNIKRSCKPYHSNTLKNGINTYYYPVNHYDNSYCTNKKGL